MITNAWDSFKALNAEREAKALAPRKVIAVWFSCGAASAVAAKKTIEKYGATHTIRVLNNPVAEEHPDNIRFKDDVAKWLGVEVEAVINPSYPSCSAEEVWDDRRFMSGIHGAPCTLLLKKEARHKNVRVFLDELPPDAKGRPMKDMNFECGIFCGKDTCDE
jgi:3'-phosphoadenosine 5'-phosphosulfate sulfotransferase (PAPS reductase)/FAD synthetase